MPGKLRNNIESLRLVNIGQNIASIRKKSGMTQAELAEKIEISRILLSDYERGRVRIYGDMVARIALILGVSADIILGRSEAKSIDPKPDLKIWKRLKKIEQLSSSKQKRMLATIDDILKANGLFP